MTESDANAELKRAKVAFLDAWRSQRIRDWETGAMLRFNPHEFWQSVLDVLLAFRKTDLSDSVTPYLVDELALLLEELIAGRVPDKVLPLLTSGSPSLRPVERRARVIAAAYVRFAKQGLIRDKRPITTIRELFRIHPNTASLWMKSPERGEPWLPSERLPLKVQADSIRWSLNAVAAEYARKGRSQAGRFNNRPTKRNRPLRGSH
ncbi:MAG TPA: hypothetical protein VJR47_10005 [Stellaceae bacterium]|nr:hypothetical protein [Stellaceae bacterium]